jgi:tricorn protease-like protein
MTKTKGMSRAFSQYIEGTSETGNPFIFEINEKEVEEIVREIVRKRLGVEAKEARVVF